MLDCFFDRLSRKYVQAPIAYVAVPERKTSGCGLPPIPYHVHFVIAAPPQHRRNLLQAIDALWKKLCGTVHIEPYTDMTCGAFYFAKLAGGIDFDFRFRNLDRMGYHGPIDIYESFQKNAFVPDHYRHRMSGKTLAVRPRRL